MIEKMKFLRITGPKDDIDRVVDQYLSKYEIHLENALSELKSVSGLRPYVESNPYKGELQTAVELTIRTASSIVTSASGIPEKGGHNRGSCTNCTPPR